MPQETSITNEQKIPFTANPTTATGRPASLDGPLRASVLSGDGTIEQDPATPNTVKLVSGDNPGDTTYLIEGDADLGAGIELIQDTVTLHVVGARAANIGLVAGAVESK